MTARTRLFALALLVAAGCHRPGPASPAYAHARAGFNRLYAAELDDAFLDPAMGEVEAELRTVPADSADHADAQALLQRITQGRDAAQKARERTRQAIEEALAPPTVTMEPSLAQDAGEPSEGPTYPAPGMPLADFQKYFGDCFHPTGQAAVADAGTVATLYALSEKPACQQRFEYFQSRVVVADSSKVLGQALKSSYQPPPDAGTAEAAGVGSAQVDAGFAASDAGAPATP